MTLAKDLEDFLRLLYAYQVEYMLVGGYALALHGKPRYTGGMDIWLDVAQENARKVIHVFREFGMASLGFKEEDFLQEGMITEIGRVPLKIDLLTSITGVFFKEAAVNMQCLTVQQDLVIRYIGLNDFVKNKIAAGRIQDLADIRALQKGKRYKPRIC